MSLFRLKDGENIILASASPRRRELLKLICEDFKSVSPDVDETVPAQVEILERPQFLAVKKAMHVCGCLSEKAVVIVGIRVPVPVIITVVGVEIVVAEVGRQHHVGTRTHGYDRSQCHATFQYHPFHSHTISLYLYIQQIQRR